MPVVKLVLEISIAFSVSFADYEYNIKTRSGALALKTDSYGIFFRLFTHRMRPQP